MLKGNPATALKEPNSVVLTEEMAEKYFGSQDPIGQTITHENERELKVTGVVKNIPENSHFKFDFLGSFGTLNDIIGTKLLTSNWGRNNYLTYVLLRKGISPDVLREKIPGFLDRHIGQLVVNSTGHPPSRPPSEGTLLYLQKLTDIHLHSHLTTELEQNGDITNVYLFTTIALFILLIACINFMNLATARSAKRAREIGLRKVLGAYRKQLIQQFLGESIYISLMAMFLAIVFVEVALPYYNDFTGKSLSLAYWDNPLIIVGLILITFLVGLLSGSYPAFMLSSFRPVSVLKGEDRSSKRSTFRTVLVVGQFTISIALIISMGVVYHQMQYFRSKKLGFNKDQVVVLPSSAQMRDNMESFKNRLMQNSNILQVTHSRLIPSDKLLNSWGGRIVDGEEPQPLNFRLAVVEVGYDFFDTYQMNLVAGRTFAKQYSTDDSAAFVLSQAAIQQLRWSQNEAIDKPLLYGNRRGRVIGVVEDMHFESLHNKIVPIIFLISESTSYKISLRISGHDIPATLAFLKNIWNEYRPDYPFEYRFLDEEIQARYESEQKLGQIFGIFSM
ncbi:MAG: FtsX-like permease family protein, partial [Phycisphaerae bacterium]|nr:FtsX-like permease family protein [Phycisphaerae bacterium]